MRYAIVGALVLTSLALVACPGSETGPQQELAPLCDDQFRVEDLLTLPHSKNVDILFVIDNTTSMAAAQVKLNQAIGPLFEQLDTAGANYRIAFTTTDNGNPWCPEAQTTPESGDFVLSSCTTRLDDFLDADGMVDARDLACNEQCSLLADELAITPTRADTDNAAAPRPWIEHIEGVSNLPAGTDMVEAFRCFAPQGVDGCGFESPLESMFWALNHALPTRDMEPPEPNAGFLRATAVLAVVLLTDEADCSYNDAWAEIFSETGNKAFWQDPEAAAPTSALCWNAGVMCSGDPTSYDSCEPAQWNTLGDPTPPDTAVLHPVGRYMGLLDALETQKQQINVEFGLEFTLIAGVEGAGADWSVTYADASDPDTQLEFGIGPGCTSAEGQTAVPPVRMRAVAEAVSPEGLYSICDPDYTASMADLGERITSQFLPLCYTTCVGDADLSTPQLEPSCTVEEYTNGDPRRLPACERAADGTYLIDPETETYQLPAEADDCYALLVDPDGSHTQDPNDDMSSECADTHFNLEFVIVRRKGVPARDGAALVPECALADCPELACPGIGG